MKIKHYALPTRKMARLYTNVLKAQGHNTTQPRSKTGGAYLVSTCTKIKKPSPKKCYSVAGNKLVK